jgi:peptidase, S41 family
MNDFKKGVLYGIAFCILAYLSINIAAISYGRFVTGDKLYEDKLKSIYNLMEDKYTGEIDKDKMFDGMYTGMVYGTTDQYSRYITSDDYKNYMQQTQGNYCGMGAITTVDALSNNVSIEGVYANSPAQKAGLQADDIIKKVGNLDVNYDTYSEAIDMIRGEENTKFNMTVYRPSTKETLNVEITRAKIDTPTVAHSLINDNIGYLRITAFEEITKDQFKNSVDELKKSNIKSLIIDLRNNPGGLLTTVTEITDEFLPKGIITYTEDKNGHKEYIYADDGQWGIPVVILVNGNSASASELFTGALKDCNVAKIVGTNTYGKGVVQTTYPFKDGSALKLTTAKYYTPNGVCIDGVGIAPDYVVEVSSDFKLPFVINNQAGYDLSIDPQLKKAVELLER